MRKAVPAGRQGFTLVELIVALGLAALFLLSASYLTNSYLKGFARIAPKAEGLQIRSFILTQMLRDIRSADRVIANAPSRLGLKLGEDTIYYDLFAAKVRRTKNGYVTYLCETGEIASLGFEYPRPGLVLIKLDSHITGGYVRNGE